MRDIECPYCLAGQDICHDDGYGYGEDELYQQECSLCGKNFVYTTFISYSYDAKKADCLNGGEHKLKPTMTFPREYTRMRCTNCDYERPCTAEEMKNIVP